MLSLSQVQYASIMQYNDACLCFVQNHIYYAPIVLTLTVLITTIYNHNVIHKTCMHSLHIVKHFYIMNSRMLTVVILQLK